MYRLLFVIGVFLSQTVFGQAPADEEPVDDGTPDSLRIYSIVEQPAEFHGGKGALYHYIATNLNYPEKARKKKEEGTVYVEFIVNKDGAISDPVVVRGATSSLNEAAITLISGMPPWVPGRHHGVPVRSRFVLPIKFNL